MGGSPRDLPAQVVQILKTGFHNDSEGTLTIAVATVTDYAGAVRAAGTDPWALERESKTLEKRYREAAIAFARMAAPRVIVSAAEPGGDAHRQLFLSDLEGLHVTRNPP